MPCTPEWYVEHSKLDRWMSDNAVRSERSVEDTTFQELHRAIPSHVHSELLQNEKALKQFKPFSNSMRVLK